MKNYLSIITIMIVFLSCSKDEIVIPNLEEQLIGRWEAIESSWVNQEGSREYYTFGPDGDFEMEYSIGIDYSSGFELMTDNRLDLIWFGENKEQFFFWKISKEHLIIDGGTLDFTIINVTESVLDLEFNNGNNTYKMRKLE